MDTLDDNAKTEIVDSAAEPIPLDEANKNLFVTDTKFMHAAAPGMC